MTKLIRRGSAMSGSGLQQRLFRWWTAILKTEETSGKPREDEPERPFKFWDLSDG